ncbi:MAG: DUF1810 domain-containing protein [Clostridia bacterium]|nr:DUF1810 domain-containing protein [Clostridia bacterium]
MEYNLDRFLKAQAYSYDEALAEIQAGGKRSHWIWYIFPQITGLGMSGMADYYAIEDIGEARAYLANDTLRARLIEISKALLGLESNDPLEVMGWPDNLKLRSSMTLFREADPSVEVFQKVLDKYYGSEPDQRTLDILGMQKKQQ